MATTAVQKMSHSHFNENKTVVGTNLAKTTYSDGANDYEILTNVTTRVIADQVVQLLPPPEGTLRIHDNCTGPGAITSVLLEHYPPSSKYNYTIDATDLAPDFLSIVDKRYVPSGVVKTQLIDAHDLSKFDDEIFDISYTLFGYHLFHAPSQAARESYRTLKTGGLHVGSVWWRLLYLPLLRDAVSRFPESMPGKQKREETVEDLDSMQTRWSQPEVIGTMFKEIGFKDVEVKQLTVWLPIDGEFDGLYVDTYAGIMDFNKEETDVFRKCLYEALEQGDHAESKDGKAGFTLTANVAFGRR